MPRAFIAGCRGPYLTGRERDFFRDANPWGFILFARNCVSREQVRSLTTALRETVGRADAPILIDQEGGRVVRLKPPHWPVYPPGRVYGRLYELDSQRGIEAVRLGARLMAHDLRTAGINVNCWPVLDVLVEGADPAIGDRAFSFHPDHVAALGLAAAAALLAGGVLPVVKHMPGQGRASRDTHKAPAHVTDPAEVLSQTDWAPFRALNSLPVGMTGHIVYDSIDPHAPATLSPVIIDSVIRGRIGFDGLLVSDDISMGALTGDSAARAESALAAGCDIVLHCNGKLSEMRSIAAAVPSLSGLAARRAEQALGCLTGETALNWPYDRARFETLIAGAGDGKRNGGV